MIKHVFSILCAILIGSILVSCGYVEEIDLVPFFYNDSNSPFLLSVTPEDGSNVETLSQVELTFSEEVSGADLVAGYTLSGSGAVSLSIDSVSQIDAQTYRLLISGVPQDGPVILTISTVQDLAGNSLSATSVSYTGWWDTDWQKRRKLTFNNADQTEDLSDFPLLVRLDDTKIDYAETQDNGEDIRFLDPDRTELSYEIEVWDESGESAVWVKVAQIDGSSSTDYIWIYYGNGTVSDSQDPENVWDDNYMLVWHLNEQPSGSQDDIKDSAENLPSPRYGHGTTQNMESSDRVDGFIGRGLDLDGSNEWIDVDSPSPGFFHDAFSYKTFEAWIKCDTTSGVRTVYDEGGSTNGFYVGVNAGNLRAVSQNSNSLYAVNSAFTDTLSYHHVVAVFDNGELIRYLDSVRATQSPGYSIGAHGGQPGFGCNADSDADDYTGGPNNYFDGIFDEVRLSDIARSEDWVKAQYLSMTDSFITFGPEE